MSNIISNSSFVRITIAGQIYSMEQNLKFFVYRYMLLNFTGEREKLNIFFFTPKILWILKKRVEKIEHTRARVFAT